MLKNVTDIVGFALVQKTRKINLETWIKTLGVGQKKHISINFPKENNTISSAERPKKVVIMQF